ncbi:RagB/SusD family nutrient uptake outer membrane protein [Chryseobacterium shigense]|uniref:SusD family protein n=1 Tax=Chryseobacterium shigense TaxID=297244 RepID=A0A841N9D8_9FLAO|nr:RagB/SusD family nutrient uptake outer membrane protein [Chryseobacterium shigense]MBB6371683.1 hypothetical protein [Chryseobacterium shigense]
MNKIIKIGLLSIGVAVTSLSCSDDFVEREFFQEVQQGPLTTDNEVQAFVRGGYATMRNTEYYGADFLAYGEVRSDEMISNLAGGYYQNVMNYTMLSNDRYAVDTYNRIYELVAKANIVINTDMATIQGTDNDRKNSRYAQGQAYGLRAIAFFDGLRLYGQKYITGGESLGIVLPLKYDPQARMARSTIAQTEAQIDADFTKALELMTANGVVTNTIKTELNINSLKGMMSRFYLYKGDYAKVRTLTSQIVATNAYSVASAALLQETFRFTMNGAAPNSIFELAVGINSSLSTGSYRQRLNPNGYANLVVNASTQAAYDASDVRRTFITLSGGQRFVSFSSNANGIGKYTQGVGADNIKMLRYEEILLNGVEAELNGGSAAQALIYYNLIVQNRGLAAAGTVDMTKLRSERMKELLGEGLRQWDLRRWGIAIPRPTGANANVDLNAFPIPRQETDLSGTLVKSNPGYDN